MILVLDLDRTLNRLYPPWARSIRELVPPALVRRAGHEMWDWLAAHLAEHTYPVHEGALPVVRVLSAGASRVIVNTGRPETARGTTNKWLRNHFRVDQLLMRARGDFRRTVEVKREHFRTDILSGHEDETIYAFDDNRDAVNMYRQHGAISLLAPQCWNSLSALATTPRDVTELLQGLQIVSRRTLMTDAKQDARELGST